MQKRQRVKGDVIYLQKVRRGLVMSKIGLLVLHFRKTVFILARTRTTPHSQDRKTNYYSFVIAYNYRVLPLIGSCVFGS